MSLRRTLALAVLVLGLVACGDDDGGSAGGAPRYSVSSALGELPDAVDEPMLMVSTADLVAATEAAGLERPSSADDMVDWALPLSADREGVVFVPFADVFGMHRSARLAEISGELGWDVTDVDWFVEGALPPDRFAVVAGGFTDAIFDDAEVVELDGGMVSAGEGDDYESDLEGVTAARPIGVPLRMAARDGLIAAGHATATVQQWSSGSGDTLADAEGWSAVAASLDDADAISAVLYRPRDDSGPGRTEGPGLTARYELGGIGWSVVDDEARIRIAYLFADEATAEEQAGRVEAIFTDGDSLTTQQPMADLLTVHGSDHDGRVMFVDVSPGPDGHVALPFQMLISRDLPFPQ